MILKKYADTKGPFVDRKIGKMDAEEVIRDLEVVTPSAETPVRRLSGGNVQKVLLGREIKAGPNVIVTAYPVRGLDINSSYAIYNILNRQKEQGVGILFVGEDLDVMMARRTMSLTELSQKVGITMANLSILKNGHAKAVRMSTLEAICKALKCQPGDILIYEESDEV